MAQPVDELKLVDLLCSALFEKSSPEDLWGRK